MIVLGIILLVVGIIGFGLAGYWDLKTTEFPDWLPYSMIIIALAVRGIFALVFADAWIFIWSLLIGGGFLGFGLLLYFSKQWGDGDAWLLGALGFLFPNETGFIVTTYFPFQLTVLFNFFFIAFFYLLVYAIALGVRNPQIAKGFFSTFRGEVKSVALIVIVFAILSAGFGMALSIMYFVPPMMFTYLMIFPILLAAILVFAHYGRFVEKHLFKRQIDAKEVREGDVPVGNRWRSLTKAEVKRIRARGGKLWIKEGVRFAPVFVITLIITVLFGGIFTIFI